MNKNLLPISIEDINKECEELKKIVYLESPDLWVDLSGKLDEKFFDESVLFFASKNDKLNIIRHAVENQKFDLNKQPKNENFDSISDLLIDESNISNSSSVYEYLSSLNNNKSTINQEETSNKYALTTLPEYTCTNCNKNLFEVGYNTTSKISYKFSSDTNKFENCSEEISNTVICNNCNQVVGNINTNDLNNLAQIETCTNCKSNLVDTGIVSKNIFKFNKESKKFEDNHIILCCNNCESKLSNKQIEYFDL